MGQGGSEPKAWVQFHSEVTRMVVLIKRAMLVLRCPTYVYCTVGFADHGPRLGYDFLHRLYHRSLWVPVCFIVRTARDGYGLYVIMDWVRLQSRVENGYVHEPSNLKDVLTLMWFPSASALVYTYHTVLLWRANHILLYKYVSVLDILNPYWTVPVG